MADDDVKERWSTKECLAEDRKRIEEGFTLEPRPTASNPARPVGLVSRQALQVWPAGHLAYSGPGRGGTRSPRPGIRVR